MKKVLATVAVSTALIIGGAAAASAAGIEMEGSVRVRGLSEQQIGATIGTAGSGAGGANEDKSPVTAYDQTVRLGMKAKPSDDLTGYILLETGYSTGDTYTWGNESTSSLFKGGTQAGVASNSPTAAAALNDTGRLGIIQAWIDYKPTKTVGLKIGHQPVAPGTKQFVNHANSGDDAIFVNYDPTASTHAHVAIVKLAENTTNDNTDDLDAYALVATHKFSDAFKVGANYVYLNGASEENAEPTPAAPVAAGIVPGMSMSNLGLDATYTVGNLTLMGDVNFQFGTIMEITGTPASTIDADGYAFQLSADYKIDKSSIGLLFAQGSGADPDGATLNDRVGNAFVTFLGDSPGQVYIPGYRKQIPGSFQQASGFGTADGNNGGLSNLTLYQLRANTSTTCALTGKPFSIRGALSYMETTEDFANYSGNREDEIGTELDVVASWKLTNNLTYMVEAAYLWTGDIYKTAASGAGSDPEDAYFLRHGITMTF